MTPKRSHSSPGIRVPPSRPCAQAPLGKDGARRRRIIHPQTNGPREEQHLANQDSCLDQDAKKQGNRTPPPPTLPLRTGAVPGTEPLWGSPRGSLPHPRLRAQSVPPKASTHHAREPRQRWVRQGTLRKPGAGKRLFSREPHTTFQSRTRRFGRGEAGTRASKDRTQSKRGKISM